MRGARCPIHRERRPRVSTSLRAAMAGDGAGDVLTRFRAQRTALHFARKRYSLPRYSRANFCGNAVPISQHSLPKKPHRRIPWRCGAVSRPAPVAVRVQHDPSLPAQCGGQMRDHCVRTNAQIELLQLRRRGNDVWRADIDGPDPAYSLGDLPALQRIQPHAGKIEILE